MRKYLPVILFLLGLVVFAGVYFFVIKGKSNPPAGGEEEPVVELPFDQKPFAALTPIKDGHWLKLQVIGIKVTGAQSMDYELLYKVKDGRTQGVPGTIKLSGQTNIERELLLGSESSGKFRYDEGVEEGTLTLRFRNDKGKLVGRVMTDFHLQTGVMALSTVDGKFIFNLSKIAKKGIFFVTMQTFAASGIATAPTEGPFGIFTEDDTLTGEPEGEWTKVDSPVSSSLGIYYK